MERKTMSGQEMSGSQFISELGNERPASEKEGVTEEMVVAETLIHGLKVPDGGWIQNDGIEPTTQGAVFDRYDPDKRVNRHRSPGQYIEDSFTDLVQTDPKLLADRLRDQIIVDLGSGSVSNMYRMLNSFEVSGYVGVDLTWAYLQKERICTEIASRKARNESCLPFAIVQADLLDFMRAIPNHSVSVITSGLEILDVFGPEYVSAVREELQRIVHHQGCWLVGDSNEPGDRKGTFLNPEFRKISSDGWRSAEAGLYVLENDQKTGPDETVI